MIRPVLAATAALAVLALTGCQSEEDQKKQQKAINDEIQRRVEVEVQHAFEMRMPDEVQRQVKVAVATEFQRQRQIEEQLKLAAQQRAAVESASKGAVAAPKKAGTPVTGTAPTATKKAAAPAPTTTKKAAH